jgi:hypothetical protein
MHERRLRYALKKNVGGGRGWEGHEGDDRSLTHRQHWDVAIKDCRQSELQDKNFLIATLIYQLKVCITNIIH